MLLIGFTEEPGWIRSTFNLTYRVPWEGLLKGGARRLPIHAQHLLGRR